MNDEHEGDNPIDLEAVSNLVADLERDLAKAKSGSGSVQALRNEVEGLRLILNQDGPAAISSGRNEPQHRRVHDGLGNIRSLFENARDELASDALGAASYVTQIGRILGM